MSQTKSQTAPSVRQLLDRFSSDTVIADGVGVSVAEVAAWRRADDIPPRYWSRLSMTALRNGIGGITPLQLARHANDKALACARRVA